MQRRIGRTALEPKRVVDTPKITPQKREEAISAIPPADVTSREEYNRMKTTIPLSKFESSYMESLYQNLVSASKLRDDVVNFLANTLRTRFDASDRELLAFGNCVRLMESHLVHKDIKTPGDFVKLFKDTGVVEVKQQGAASLIKLIRMLVARKHGEEVLRKADIHMLGNKKLEELNPIYVTLAENFLENSLDLQLDLGRIETFSELAEKLGYNDMFTDYESVDAVMKDIKKIAEREYLVHAKMAGVKDIAKGWRQISPIYEALHILLKEKDENEPVRIGGWFGNVMKSKRKWVGIALVAGLTAISYFALKTEPETKEFVCGLDKSREPMICNTETVNSSIDYTGFLQPLDVAENLSKYVQDMTGQALVYLDEAGNYLFNNALFGNTLANDKKNVKDLAEITRKRLDWILGVQNSADLSYSSKFLLQRLEISYIRSLWMEGLAKHFYPALNRIVKNLYTVRNMGIRETRKDMLGPAEGLVSPEYARYIGWFRGIDPEMVVDRSLIPQDFKMSFKNVTIEYEGYDVVLDYEKQLKEIIDVMLKEKSFESISEVMTQYCLNLFTGLVGKKRYPMEIAESLKKLNDIMNLVTTTYGSLGTGLKFDTKKLSQFVYSAEKGILHIDDDFIKSKQGTRIGIAIQSHIDTVAKMQSRYTKDAMLEMFRDITYKAGRTWTATKHEKRDTWTEWVTSFIPNHESESMCRNVQIMAFASELKGIHERGIYNSIDKTIRGALPDQIEDYPLLYLKHFAGGHELQKLETLAHGTVYQLNNFFVVQNPISYLFDKLGYMSSKAKDRGKWHTEQAIVTLLSDTSSLLSVIQYSLLALTFFNSVLYVIGKTPTQVEADYVKKFNEQLKTLSTDPIMHTETKESRLYGIARNTANRISGFVTKFIFVSKTFKETGLTLFTIGMMTKWTLSLLLAIDAIRHDILWSEQTMVGVVILSFFPDVVSEFFGFKTWTNIFVGGAGATSLLLYSWPYIKPLLIGKEIFQNDEQKIAIFEEMMKREFAPLLRKDYSDTINSLENIIRKNVGGDTWEKFKLKWIREYQEIYERFIEEPDPGKKAKAKSELRELTLIISDEAMKMYYGEYEEPPPKLSYTYDIEWQNKMYDELKKNLASVKQSPDPATRILRHASRRSRYPILKYLATIYLWGTDKVRKFALTYSSFKPSRFSRTYALMIGLMSFSGAYLGGMEATGGLLPDISTASRSIGALSQLKVSEKGWGRDTSLSVIDAAQLLTQESSFFNVNALKDWSHMFFHKTDPELSRLLSGIDMTKWDNFKVQSEFELTSVEKALYNYYFEAGRQDLLTESPDKLRTLSPNADYYLGQYFYLVKRYAYEPNVMYEVWTIKSLYNDSVFSIELKSYDKNTHIATDISGRTFDLTGIQLYTEQKLIEAIRENRRAYWFERFKEWIPEIPTIL